ncbi:MAG: hypothetical protein HY690_09435 [Chloroflexi bacterium]|nr:hypothetical protein [Chloroflexota bacterium]
MAEPEGEPGFLDHARPDDAPALPPPPGQMAIVLAALAIGVLLMGIQLWLLTVALDLFLAGQGERVWVLALVSGGIFLGGLLMLWLLHRRPRVRRTWR